MLMCVGFVCVCVGGLYIYAYIYIERVFDWGKDIWQYLWACNIIWIYVLCENIHTHITLIDIEMEFHCDVHIIHLRMWY